ncbi:unknown protein [Desulfotalea psychrophila LSv54]|uniref:Uncharacterized protein n=1 Tax=Desulfotalea psychrophila (strain LSv54 / DSM 12343) TaxID=177439 RepID=Q6ANJ6_DESPS|nr:unknown protein [Desulfotalea psychrophila LSv54]
MQKLIAVANRFYFDAVIMCPSLFRKKHHRKISVLIINANLEISNIMRTINIRKSVIMAKCGKAQSNNNGDYSNNSGLYDKVNSHS